MFFSWYVTQRWFHISFVIYHIYDSNLLKLGTAVVKGLIHDLLQFYTNEHAVISLFGINTL